MATMGGGSGGGPPKPGRGLAPPPAPPQRHRPPIRPISGARPPVLRPSNMRPPAPPRAPTPPPAVSEESDDDLTSVMTRAPFEEMGGGEPFRQELPSLHDDDHARGETMIMSEAPMRGMLGRPIPPPNLRREPRPPPDPFGRGARFEPQPPVHTHGRPRPGSPGTFPPPEAPRRNAGELPRAGGSARPQAPSVPPLDELVPPATHHLPPSPARHRRSTTPPPSGGTVQIARAAPGASGRPVFNGGVTAPLGHPVMNPLAPPPQAPPAALPRPDPSLAVARAAMAPLRPEGAMKSAPPIVGGHGASFRPQPAIGGSGVYAPHGAPARVGTNPPPAVTVRPAVAASGSVAAPAAPLSTSGIIGLVLFALPLALAMFVVAALALL